MFLDALLQLSSAQAITAADAYSTNTIDLGNVTPKRRVGTGEPLCLIVAVTTAAAGDGSPATFTNNFDLMAVESDNANLSSHDVMVQRRVPGAELVAGKIVVIPIPPDRPLKRYIGARYELGTDDTVTISAWIAPMSMVSVLANAYARGYVID